MERSEFHEVRNHTPVHQEEVEEPSLLYLLLVVVCVAGITLGAIWGLSKIVPVASPAVGQAMNGFSNSLLPPMPR